MFVKFYKFFPLFLLVSCNSFYTTSHPIHNDLLLNLNYAEKGDCKKALEAIIHVTPQTPQDNLLLGKIYKNCQQNDKAQIYFSEVIKSEIKENNIIIEALELKGKVFIHYTPRKIKM